MRMKLQDMLSGHRWERFETIVQQFIALIYLPKNAFNSRYYFK
jgi:hypothetical protein